MNLRRTGELVGAAVLVAALLITAIIALIDVNSRSDGTSRPAAQRTSASAASPSATRSAASSPVAETSPASPTPTPTRTPAGPVTYRVKHGDNLTVIARWFKLHGYGALYERNRDVIGDDPNLIVPGQRITISPTGVTTSQ